MKDITKAVHSDRGSSKIWGPQQLFFSVFNRNCSDNLIQRLNHSPLGNLIGFSVSCRAILHTYPHVYLQTLSSSPIMTHQTEGILATWTPSELWTAAKHYFLLHTDKRQNENSSKSIQVVELLVGCFVLFFLSTFSFPIFSLIIIHIEEC